MPTQESQLLSILRIGYEASSRDSGVSLRDAIVNTRYQQLRSMFGAGDLVPLIRDHLAFCSEWLAYSADKRTRGGWYLLESGEIGQLDHDRSDAFDSIEVAVAHYVVRELDYWSSHSGG